MPSLHFVGTPVSMRDSTPGRHLLLPADPLFHPGGVKVIDFSFPNYGPC